MGSGGIFIDFFRDYLEKAAEAEGDGHGARLDSFV